MADLFPQAAVNDILWLQARFKGIMDLADKLQDVGNLENYSAELAVSTKSLKAENAKLVSEKLDLETAIQAAKDEAADIIAKATAEAKKLEDNAKLDSEAYRISARESAAAEVLELQGQKLQKQKEIAALKDTFASLQADVAAQQKTYEDLVAMINELKARF